MLHRVLEMKRSGVGQTHPQFFDMLLSIKNEVENLSSVLLSHRGFAEYPAEKILGIKRAPRSSEFRKDFIK